MMKKSDKTLIIIAGPTAVGKTSISIELAKIFQAEIISADSRQFYREIKIGTATPSLAELQEVKHHFIGHLSIDDDYNVSKYESDAIAKLSELFNKYNKVVMVGGSGLYINTIIHGIDNLPGAEESTRSYLKILYKTEGVASLRQLLKQLDPEYYSQVDMKNQTRLIRALEVCLTTGEKYSTLRKNVKKERQFNYIYVGLNRKREELFNRIRIRTDKMIHDGLVEEAKTLLPFRKLNALNTVGYKEIFEYFDGTFSLEQAIENIKTNTRRYAKRQLTWFKKQPEIQWFHQEDMTEMVKLLNG